MKKITPPLPQLPPIQNSDDNSPTTQRSPSSSPQQQQQQQQQIHRQQQVAADTNHLVYEAIQNHKKMDLERQMSVLRDNQSITESMMRKRREADENKSVVTASSMYANNVQYVSINSGNDQRIRLGKHMHPLSPDECDVYTSLVESTENSTISACMNHHISDAGEIEGFRYTCSGSDMANCMPISRKMFFRVSMVECFEDTSSSTQDGADDEGSDEDDMTTVHGGGGDEVGSVRNGGWSVASGTVAGDFETLMEHYNSTIEEANRGQKQTNRHKKEIGLTTAAMLSNRTIMNPLSQCRLGYGGGDRESSTILRLLTRQNEVKNRLVRLVQSIHKSSVGKEVSFDCMPDNTDILEKSMAWGGLDHVSVYGSMYNRRAADCTPWNPEAPEFVGIYHAYVRGFNKDTRTHKLFIVTSGGCTSMCDTYFNLFVDIRNHMRVADVYNSQETWFLQNACRRNNARILSAVAKEFGLNIPQVVDTYSTEREKIASCTTETIQYDIIQEKHSRYSLCNRSVDQTRSDNGILCPMHPAEGVWLFKGPVQTNSALALYGGPFGSAGSSKSTAFPVGTTRLSSNYCWKSKSVPGSSVCLGTPCTVSSKNSRCVARVDANASLVGFPIEGESYTYVDETYIRALQDDCQWARDNGIVELIPIAVVQQVGYM